MSLKYYAIADRSNRYVLPKTGSMKCDVIAYLSEQLYQQSEEALWQQAAQAASYEGAIGVYLMPDCHLGYGIPVGGVLITEDTIVQAGSGYDISCGVAYLKVPTLHASDVADFKKRQQWISEIEQRIATGLGSHQPKYRTNIKSQQLSEILRYGAKALGISADLCERQFITVSDTFNERKILKAFNKARPQLGSVGGGNHFIEMQVDQEDGSVWIMIHCGSRGYGWQTANHFFYEGAKLRGLQRNRREESWLRFDEELGREYWDYHNSAANYAVANRHQIVHGIREATQQVFNADVELFYEISHNLVQQETIYLPDGEIKTGFVHRKGATRAFPANHPGLRGSKWESTGHPCLIPGSMYDGAAILFPRQGALESGCSVNHGSGRIMARGKAKRELHPLQQDINNEMKHVTRVLGGIKITGIASNCPNIPLDECCHVYKNLDDVLQVLEDENVASVHRRLYPVANIKGVD